HSRLSVYFRHRLHAQGNHRSAGTIPRALEAFLAPNDPGRSHRPTGRRDATLLPRTASRPASRRAKPRASAPRAAGTNPPRTVTAHKKEFILTLEGVNKTFEGF